MKYVLKRIFLKFLLFLILVATVATLGGYLINGRVISTTENDILYVMQGKSEIKQLAVKALKDLDADCALVLGCGIVDENTPSDMLKDRLDAGIELYRQGIVPKLLLSGDNGQEHYNEIHVMFNYAKDAGIPAEDIFCDHAGFSTYDSMHRAGSIFGCSKVIVVTQQYHQYRAIFIGEKLGLEAYGVASNQRSYFGQTYRDAREVLARIKDSFKVLLRCKPTYGGEAIPISGSGIFSHDE